MELKLGQAAVDYAKKQRNKRDILAWIIGSFAGQEAFEKFKFWNPKKYPKELGYNVAEAGWDMTINQGSEEYLDYCKKVRAEYYKLVGRAKWAW